MKSLDIYEQDQAVILLRKTTRTNEDSRTVLCSERFLFALKQLLNSCYAALQTNAAAALVNLSLEKEKKIKIVRAGVVPLLIEILKSGYEESREHAAGAIFSLALEDENKTAIGVLGALQPLLHELRSGTRRSRHDAALALYHLTLVQSNRVKIMKLGAVGILLGLLKEAEVTARVILAQKHASVRRSSTPQDVRHVSDASLTFPSGSAPSTRTFTGKAQTAANPAVGVSAPHPVTYPANTKLSSFAQLQLRPSGSLRCRRPAARRRGAAGLD